MQSPQQYRGGAKSVANLSTYKVGISGLILGISIALSGCQEGQNKTNLKVNRTLDGDEKNKVDLSSSEKQLSLKEEFAKKITETNNGRREISQNECAELTNKAIFKYHSDGQFSIPIYLIVDELVPIETTGDRKCLISNPIILEKSLTSFTHSETGAPLTKLEELWSLEKIEGCQQDNYQYVPNCKTLVKYTKEIFVDDSSNSGDIIRQEFSIHHRQPLNSWAQKECHLVQGIESGDCNAYHSQQLLKSYREYIISGRSESFEEYTAYKAVQID